MFSPLEKGQNIDRRDLFGTELPYQISWEKEADKRVLVQSILFCVWATPKSFIMLKSGS